jgi:hypothetical protein
MNAERMAKLGALSDLKKRRAELAGSIDADLRAAKEALALSSVTRIEKLDIERAAHFISAASIQKARYMEILQQIRALSEELGE